jgi:hypothetical protein
MSHFGMWIRGEVGIIAIERDELITID